MVNLNTIKSDKNWSFADVSRRETRYATHGYHRYPAKFIPQIVKKIIIKYSKRGDLVLDSFGGCGTTLVESKLNGRESIGLDVNEVAVLIAKAKTIGINPQILEERNKSLFERISNNRDFNNNFDNANKRLQYWFKPEEFNKLMIIYNCIQGEEASKVRLFYNCCFSNILKNCSIWYSKSIKPMRDDSKKIAEPISAFTRHLDYMVRKNKEYVDLLKAKKVEDVLCQMKKGDARKINLPDGHVDLVVTSPPYVTSYEYAELHQLSILWFNFADDIKDIKKDFVGTSSRENTRRNINSVLAEDTIEKLSKKNGKLFRHVSNYYSDLSRCYEEMYRVLKKDKYACIIIGDTEYGNIKIPNAEVTIELLKNIGFDFKKVIKRKLSSKIFTPFRDKSGRFTDAKHGGKRKIYQYEYIIFAKK
ncbi:MAG: DNA methyltransferase [Candidatus Omnitrophota bacterium]|nr:DNA methyltransferase [Candidatus Omnitrophota bacterium]